MLRLPALFIETLVSTIDIAFNTFYTCRQQKLFCGMAPQGLSLGVFCLGVIVSQGEEDGHLRQIQPKKSAGFAATIKSSHRCSVHAVRTPRHLLLLYLLLYLLLLLICSNLL